MNNQNNIKVVGFFCSLLLILSSCNKIIDWGANNFKAADMYAKKYISPVQGYFRSESAYVRYFTAVGQFTGLLLSGNVRKSYAEYYAHRNSLDTQEKSLLCRRLEDENNHFISFYVTGEQPVATYSSSKAYFSGSYNKQSPIMGTSDPAWKPYLQVDGKEYSPHHVKKVDLSPEYIQFFGDRASQFKKVYLVMFDVQIDDSPHDLSLVFRSAEVEIKLLWEQELYGFNAPIKENKSMIDQ